MRSTRNSINKLMTKKIIAVILLVIVLCCFAFACKKDEEHVSVRFGSTYVVSESFDGLGVEWGTYEDTNKMVKGSWPRVLSAVDKLKPTLVRCMTNLDWFVTDFDNKDTEAASDDTWNYNFNNKQMLNASNVLDYCQAHGIKVAFGVWNVIGNADPEKDIYGMIPNASADPRWAKMCADLMEYLVKVKGYTCIRWFVNTNEPNVIGTRGTSKNAYNTPDIWVQGVRNVRAALDGIGLKDLAIVGGDTTQVLGSKLYLEKIAKEIPDIIDNYGVHLYVNNSQIDKGEYEAMLREFYYTLQDKDKALGNSKQMYIWEAGLLSGKNQATDCNDLIMTYGYGLRMADYTVQSLNAGINGIVFWDLDDAMHFMYTENGTTAKEWGMFSTLATAEIGKQEYRPWYHSSVLLTNVLRPGNTLYGAKNLPEGLRTIASVNSDRTQGGIVVVNNSKKTITQEMILDEEIKTEGKLYVYLYNEKTLNLDENGFVTPNIVIDGSLNNKIKMEIPAYTMLVVSTERI